MLFPRSVTVPRRPESTQGRRSPGIQTTAQSDHEGLELVHVCVLGLTIDVPYERSSGPLCADERILAANEVQIARPEQAVIAILCRKRQHLRNQPPPLENGSGVQGGRTEEARDVGQDPPFGDQRDNVLLALRPGLQQFGQGWLLIAEQGHQQGVSRLAVQAETMHEGLARAGPGQMAITLGQQVRLAQQPAGRRRKSRDEEVLEQGQRRMRRALEMTVIDPGLGRQILEIDP
jgi:hypothetical protein